MSEQKSEAAVHEVWLAEQSDEVPWWRNHPWLGGHLFHENRNKNLELLEQFEKKWVAWYPDGSGIRGAAQDVYALWLRIKETGEDPQWYHYELINNDTMI